MPMNTCHTPVVPMGSMGSASRFQPLKLPTTLTAAALGAHTANR